MLSALRRVWSTPGAVVMTAPWEGSVTLTPAAFDHFFPSIALRAGDENFPILVEGLANETIIRVACGDGQTLAVSTTGDVWGWGTYKDKEGKTWFNPSADSPKIQKQQKEPIKIMVHHFLPPLLNLPQGISSIVVDVACGSAHNLARCSDGTVYSWGLGECGELGREVCPMKKSGEYDLAGILR